jgi:plasmid stability protein
MAEVLVPNVSEGTIALLERRAKRHGRSIEEEARQIIEDSTHVDFSEARRGVEEVRAMLAGRRFSDSSELIRQDRER